MSICGQLQKIWLIGGLLVLAACNGSPAPTVIASTPSNNSKGVLADAVIQITFSEPMNTTATQNAYQSSSDGIKPAQVQFDWNSASTVLTITPNGLLALATGTDPAAVVANDFAFQMSSTAISQKGVALAPFSSSFTTQRRITQNLPVLSALTGDVRSDQAVNQCANGFPCAGDSGAVANAQFKGFISFNIANLPTDIQEFETANLNLGQTAVGGAPYSGFGSLVVNHVNFATLNFALAFHATSLQALGTLSNDANLEVKTLGVLTALKDDYSKRSTRGNRTQYRLAFVNATDSDNALDAATFGGPNSLNTSYLLP
jgi:hypothetical protein